MFLQDILEAIKKIEEYGEGLNFAHFKKSPMVIDAVVRNLEIIGEAVSQLPEKIKEKHTDVPWQEVKNFRNIVIHKYFTIDVEIVWNIIKSKLDTLKRQIAFVLKREQG